MLNIIPYPISFVILRNPMPAIPEDSSAALRRNRILGGSFCTAKPWERTQSAISEKMDPISEKIDPRRVYVKLLLP
jgi:hypothetical protein